jgi:hypothetical protein
VTGGGAKPGHTTEQDWQEILPYELLPGVLNPAAGYLYSGNHRPIESWYPIPLGAMTGTGGDTIRSWRLRERLASREQYTPEEVRAIHFDAVNPARRDLVRLALSPGESKPATRGRNAAAGGYVEKSPPDLRCDRYEMQGADAPALPGSSSFLSRLGFFDPGGEMAGFDSSSGGSGVSGGVTGPVWFLSR